MTTLDDRSLALHAAHLCAEKGGVDVIVLELPAGAEFSYAVIASARSDRQTYAIADEVYGFCKTRRIPHRPVEGEAGWMLIDCFNVIVHAMGEPQREYYQLERLWKNAKLVDHEAEYARLPRLPDAPLRRGRAPAAVAADDLPAGD